MRARLRSAEFCKLGRLAPTDRKPMQLLEETTVLPEEIDSLGQMNVRFYMTRMEQANRVLIANLGIDEDALSGSFLRSADTYTLSPRAIRRGHVARDRRPSRWR
jgi:hypothetical protein